MLKKKYLNQLTCSFCAIEVECIVDLEKCSECKAAICTTCQCAIGFDDDGEHYSCPHCTKKRLMTELTALYQEYPQVNQLGAIFRCC